MTALTDLTLLASGKVREIYDAGETLLIVASDRISTYDVIHPNPIPGKGEVLTGLSAFWFEHTGGIVPNHMLSVAEGVPQEVRGRGMVVRKLKMLPVECVVRGYITGSGWKDYQRTGAVCGIELPAGLRESDKLPEPIFTPSTKATVGHDENIDFEGAVELIGDRALAERLQKASLETYAAAADHARERGIILADTKFEFGLDGDGQLVLGDEICTPDSSRFWPVDGYEPRAIAAKLRQAVRARLGVLDGVGSQSAGARDSRGDSRAHAGEVPGRLRADYERAVRGMAQPHAGLMRARVLVRPKEGILDPQGQTVHRALKALGFAGVRDVHVGRLIELELDDSERLPEMCERLLANPLIEDWEIEDDHRVPEREADRP